MSQHRSHPGFGSGQPRYPGTFLLLEDRLSAFTERWPIAIGLIFMTFVLFLPKGIWGTLTGGRHGHQSA